MQGIITEEEAKTLKAKHIKITAGEQNYLYCLEVKDVLNNSDNNSKNDTSDNTKVSVEYKQDNENKGYYYCYNDEETELDYIIISGDNHFKIIESL